MNYVYGLTSVKDQYVVRYVGQSKRLDRRFDAHLRRSTVRTKLNAWLNSRRAEGYEILLVILKSNAIWDEDEQFFIHNYRARNFKLLNMTSGGDGGAMPRASIDRGLAKRRARPRTERELAAPQLIGQSVRRTIAERGGHWSKGVPLTAEHRQKIITAATGKKRGPYGPAAHRGRRLNAMHKIALQEAALRRHEDAL